MLSRRLTGEAKRTVKKAITSKGEVLGVVEIWSVYVYTLINDKNKGVHSLLKGLCVASTIEEVKEMIGNISRNPLGVFALINPIFEHCTDCPDLTQWEMIQIGLQEIYLKEHLTTTYSVAA